MKRSFPRTSRSGFTLIELIVAVTVAMVLLILVGQIFASTRRVVSRGHGTSDIISNVRAAKSQFASDFADMLGPDDNTGLTPEASGGVLIIVHKVYGDFNGNGVLDGDTDPDGGGPLLPDGVLDEDEIAALNGNTEGVEFRTGTGKIERRLVRSDQLAFVVTRDDRLPMAPSGADGFTTGGNALGSPYLLVRYAHGKRTLESGADDGQVLVDSTRAGGAGFETSGTDWVLCRQAMFMHDSTTGEPFPSRRYLGVWPHATGNAAMGDYTTLYMGLQDYSRYSLASATPGAPSNAGDGSMVGLDQTGSATTNRTRRLASSIAALSVANYRRTAFENYTFATQRIRFNPLPLRDEANDNYDSWRVGQMHPIFLTHCSDFAVEFAADIYDAPIQVGVNPGAPPAVPDGIIDTDENGDIVWYTSEPFANPTAVKALGPRTYSVPTGTSDFTPYHAPSNPANLNATSNGMPDNIVLANLNSGFVFRHDDEPIGAGNGKFFTDPDDTQTSHWPYLIRLRYRLHDPRGEVQSGDGVNGIWFEQILKVNRPPLREVAP